MKKIYLLFATILTLGVASSNAQCFADFQFFVNGSTVNFQDSSSFQFGAFPNHYWDFGDGNNGFGTNPSNTYSAAGNYTVCLTISDTNTNCYDTICKVVTVNNVNPQPCNASFTYTTNNNNVASFTSTVTGGVVPYTYSWDFGNGNSSTLANPTHNYATTGAYVATLTVTGSNGVTCSYSDTVIVNFCNAYFTSSVNSNGVANFTNQSTPNRAGVAYSWDFGDGSQAYVKHPTHTYTVSNLYVVTLSIYDSLANCNSTFSDTINVQVGTQNQCNASYTIAKDSSLAYGVILYNTSSNFGSHFYSWDFGDGTTGSGRTPIHQYQSFGSYVVCLTITDSILNCTSTFCDTVGMDTLGNLKSGFGLTVQDPTITGIDENETLNAVSIYPNPATSNLSLDLTAVGSVLNVQLFDLSGRKVMELKNQVGGNLETIDVSSISNGIYFISLNDGVNQVTKKFIKH